MVDERYSAAMQLAQSTGAGHQGMLEVDYNGSIIPLMRSDGLCCNSYQEEVSRQRQQHSSDTDSDAAALYYSGEPLSVEARLPVLPGLVKKTTDTQKHDQR